MASIKSVRSVVYGVTLTTSMLLLAHPAYAQVTTAKILGTVTGEKTEIISVVARNVETGFRVQGQVSENGFYVISGLTPGDYEISFSVRGEVVEKRALNVSIGGDYDVDVALGSQSIMEEIKITGYRGTAPVKTSEVSTNVSRAQIENLPQNSRNFLNFARLAPGVTLSNDEQRQQFAHGAQGASQTNYYIDGVNMKNNLNTGGGIGQDSSRGSPFSQLSIREFRVVTQNFKAEYEQAGSAIITAVTRSGTNKLSGEIFGLYQDAGMIELDRFAKERGDEKPNFNRKQFGGALGGPIIKDKMHFFVSYEGNRQSRVSEVFLGGRANDDDRARFGQYEGTFDTPFKSDLYFAKIDFQPNEKQWLELSASLRRETDLREVGGTNTIDHGRDIVNDSLSAVFKHSYNFDNGAFNEFTVNYLDSSWGEEPRSTDPYLIYDGVINLGGHTFQQDADQSSVTLRNNYTLPTLDWMGAHVIKIGAKAAFYDYYQAKLDHRNPAYTFRKDEDENFRDRPDEVAFAPLRAELSEKNTQLGIFIQDDWEVTDKLLINIGLRYDYETNPMNRDFVTPDHLANTLRIIDTLQEDQAALSAYLTDKANAWPWAQSLNVGVADGIVANDPDYFDPERYITDGTQRKAYAGAIQPRIGFSYDVFGDQKTVLFAGAGRYVDRTLFNFTADETMRFLSPRYTVRFSDDGGNGTVAWDPRYLDPANLTELFETQQARPEVLLMPNDLKPVMSDQFNFGVRQQFGEFRTSLTFSYITSDNGLSYRFANIAQYKPQLDWWQFLLEDLDPTAQVGNILVADNDRKTRYKSVALTVDKPFTTESGWGMTLTYTLSDAKQKGYDTFNFEYASAEQTPWTKNLGHSTHNLVASGIVALPLNIKLSGLLNYRSGERYNIYRIGEGETYDPYNFIFPGEGKKDGFMSIDLRIAKTFNVMGTEFTLIAEGFNIFNATNYDYYVNWDVPWETAFGEARTAYTGSTRRFQIGASLKF